MSAKDDLFANLSINDLAPGDYFEYDLKSWKVTGENAYRWKDNSTSREFRVSTGGEVRFLEIEDGDLETLSISRKISLSALSGNIHQTIRKKGSPPDSIDYQQETYILEGEFKGSYQEVGSWESWEKFTCWDYKNKAGNHLLTIERWDPREFEVYAGKILDATEISAITKGEKQSTSSFGGNSMASWLFGIFAFILFFIFSLSTCGSSKGFQSNYKGEEGLQKLLKAHDKTSDFTVLLNDMDYQDGRYLHRYGLLIPTKDTTVNTAETSWMEVSQPFFKKHKNDLGMELANKKNGQLTIRTAPPGFSEYVGNEEYGQWEKRDRDNIWIFFSRYRPYRTFFNTDRRPARQRDYTVFNRTYKGKANYYGNDRYYGTNPYLNTNKGRGATWGKRSTSFRQRALEEQRSGGASNNKTSRNGSRYSNTSSRSRSGGFGK